MKCKKAKDLINREAQEVTLSVPAVAPSDDDIIRSSQRTEYLVFFGLSALLLVMGLVLSPSLEDAVSGYEYLVTHPSLLDFDALLWAGNYGTAFINASLMLLMTLLVCWLTHTELQGAEIASILLVTGFAFYGKNPINIWFPALGVFLHAKLHKKPLNSCMAVAWFSTALSPVFSSTAYGAQNLVPGSTFAILLGITLAILAGYVTAVLVAYLPRLHKGRTLYNAGFAAGIAGMLINAIKTSLSIGHERYSYFSEHFISDDNLRLAGLLLILFLYLIMTGLSLGGGPKYRSMLWYRCYGGNFIQEFGFGASLINMGVVGIFSCLYVFATINGHFNGPVYACILTAAGFAAAGVTIREFLPTMAGVYLAAFLTGGLGAELTGGMFLSGALEKISSRGMILAAIFSCGLAPVAGSFGPLAGIFVGAVHSILVPLTGSLHGWMSLYNNAFSMGIIIVFLFPLYSKLKIGKREREIHIGPED